MNSLAPTVLVAADYTHTCTVFPDRSLKNTICARAQARPPTVIQTIGHRCISSMLEVDAHYIPVFISFLLSFPCRHHRNGTDDVPTPRPRSARILPRLPRSPPARGAARPSRATTPSAASPGFP